MWVRIPQGAKSSIFFNEGVLLQLILLVILVVLLLLVVVLLVVIVTLLAVPAVVIYVGQYSSRSSTKAPKQISDYNCF